MLTKAELAVALTGVRRVLLCKADAFDQFDATPRGFWNSFWVAFLILPVWAFLLVDQESAAGHPQPFRYFAIQGIGYAISWIAYPLIMIRISDFLDRWPRYFRYMVAYNWFQLVQTIVWLPLVLLIDAGAPQSLVALIWLATHGVLLGYSWFIARRGLKVEAGTACALVLIDLLLSLLIDKLADALV
jgi:hypothetical protein